MLAEVLSTLSIPKIRIPECLQPYFYQVNIYPKFLYFPSPLRASTPTKYVTVWTQERKQILEPANLMYLHVWYLKSGPPEQAEGRTNQNFGPRQNKILLMPLCLDCYY